MNRWILSRLFVLTVVALFLLAYFIHTRTSYLGTQTPDYVHREASPPKPFPHQSEDQLQGLAVARPVTGGQTANDPLEVDLKRSYETDAAQRPPDKVYQPLSRAITRFDWQSTETLFKAPSSDKATEPASSSNAMPEFQSIVPATQSFVTASVRALSEIPAAQSAVPLRLSQDQSPPSPVNDDDLSNHEFRPEYEKLTCKFPLLDPWDDSIMPFLSHPQPLICPRVQPDLTYVDLDGHLRFNETEYQKAVSMYGNLSCFYRHFDKLDENDHSVMYVDGGKFFDPLSAVRLTHQNVEVKCERSSKTSDRTTGNEVYWGIHAHPIIGSTQSIRATKTEQPSLSVLIVGVDSISLSAFRRHWPLTYAYLRDVMRFHMFRGHHKIGDNSFPNQMAVLLGKRVANESWPNMMDEMREEYFRIRFDHWPLLWRTFAEKGYETSFNEDTPHWGLFHYFSQGFLEKPVRHYYHQYWLALEKGQRRYQKYCFGNKAKLEMQLDLVRRHLTIGRERKWFDYMFATEFFHQDEGYEAEKADPYFLKFFQEMYKGGYFDKTVVIFMSDHGHRYASLRQTLVGLLEERLPMFNIWFPDWFYKGNDFKETLHRNTVRLTSHFDVHETLLDILHNNYHSSQRPSGTRGLSLLYPISPDRTCAQAGVPDHYCTCLSEKTIPANDSSSAGAVKSAIAHLNLILANSSSCSPLSLSRILRVERLGVNEKIARGVSDLKSAREFDAETGAPTMTPLNKLRVTFVATPGNALFEAIIAWNNWKSLWVVDGRIHRVNAYAATAHCIHDRLLARYCICINSTTG